MKRIFLLILLIISITQLFSQVENRFRGTLNVFGASGTTPNYIITGFFNDPQGRYASDSTSVGDWLYLNSGDECVRFQIDSILSVAGGIVNVRVVDVDNQTVSFPTGIGGLLSETPNYGFPNFISGLSEDLLACMRTHFTEKVDLITAAVNVEDSETIDHTLSGDTISSDAIISKVFGNLLKVYVGLSPDSLNGMYVLANTNNITLNKLYFGLSTNISDVFDLLQDSIHVHENGQTIEFGWRAPVGDEIFPRVDGEVIVSPDAGNTLEIKANGLYSTGGVNIISFTRGDAAITATDSVGVSFSSAAGVGTLAYPDSVTIFSIGISGEAADLAGDNSYSVILDRSASAGINDNIASMLAPVVNVINTASQIGGGPSNALPFVYDEGSSPQVQITGIGSGDITLRVINLNAFSNYQISIRP